MAANPILVEATRGSLMESAHRGAVAVYDADGHMVLELGDVDRPTFPRSSVKAIQALPLIETGAADKLLFGEQELALACASHNGETEHAALASAMLARSGLGESDLECGVHWPFTQDVAIQLARSGGEPTQLHNNCSGKHSGFLSVCVHCGIDHQGYVGHQHPLQEMVRETMEEVTGFQHGEENRGTDGCSIPTYAVPLSNLARSFAAMATGQGFGRERAQAARRLIDACMAHPFLVAGTNRADTRLMETAPGRVFVKTGAEGVYCGAIPELGLGIALKCGDGAGRAAEVAVAAVLAKLFKADEALADRLRQLASPNLRNWQGTIVGTLRPTTALS